MANYAVSTSTYLGQVNYFTMNGRNTGQVNVVWLPGRQPDLTSADLLSYQEEPWLSEHRLPEHCYPAALYTLEARDLDKKSEILEEHVHVMLRVLYRYQYSLLFKRVGP